MSDGKDDDYAVGYGRPPRSGQFQPAQSGNPKGRPPGVRNLKTDLEDELSQLVTLTEGGRRVVTTKQQAMLKAQIAKAISGDTKATVVILDLKARLSGEGPSDQDQEIDDDELDILSNGINREKARQTDE